MKQITTPLILLLCLAPCVVAAATKAPSAQQTVITAELLEQAFEITPEKPTGNLGLLADAVKAGADFNKPFAAGFSPLSLAIIRKNIEAIKFLIKHGADVNRAEITMQLEPSVRSTFKFTRYPLRTAIDMLERDGNTEIVTYLIDQGADVNVIEGGVDVNDPESGFGITLLGNAILGWHDNIAVMLLQRGADPQKLSVVYKKNVDSKDGLLLQRQPIIQLAAFGLMSKLIAELLRRKIPITKNYMNQTPLHLACTARSQLGDPKSLLTSEQRRARLAEVTGILLKHGVNINDQDVSGDTALHALLQGQNPEYIDILLKFKPDPTIKNNAGTTAIDLARLRRNADDDKTVWDAIIKKMEEMAKEKKS